jgi:hypothetical protein
LPGGHRAARRRRRWPPPGLGFGGAPGRRGAPGSAPAPRHPTIARWSPPNVVDRPRDDGVEAIALLHLVEHERTVLHAAELLEVRREILGGAEPGAQLRLGEQLGRARERGVVGARRRQRRRLGRRIAPQLGAQRRIVAFHARLAGARVLERTAHQIVGVPPIDRREPHVVPLLQLAA